MTNREGPPADDRNSAGQREPCAGPPSGGRRAEGARPVQPACSLAWDTRAGYPGFVAGRAGVRLVAVPHRQPTATLKEKTHTASLSSFLGSTQRSTAKVLQQTFPDRLISRQPGAP